MRELLKLKEVAELFGVTVPTVRRWLKDKDLTCIRTPGGGIRVPADAFQLHWERVVNDDGE